MEMRLAAFVKKISYRYIVWTDPAFWEPETTISWNRVPEWINLKTTHLWLCVQPIHIFCETSICHHPKSRKVYAHAPSLLLFSVSQWQNYSATYWSGMYTTSFWVGFTDISWDELFLEQRKKSLNRESSGIVWMSQEGPLPIEKHRFLKGH